MNLSRRTTLKLLAASTHSRRTRNARITATPPPQPSTTRRPPPTSPTHPHPAPPNFGTAPGHLPPHTPTPSPPQWRCTPKLVHRDAKSRPLGTLGPPMPTPKWATGTPSASYAILRQRHQHLQIPLQKVRPPLQVRHKDVINTWKAEKWDPEFKHLISLYQKSQPPKFFAAMANHHDNFDMFDSTYQPWNSTKIGPKTDIVGRWEKAARNAGLKFALTSHGDRSCSHRMPGARQRARLHRPPGRRSIRRPRLQSRRHPAKWWEGLSTPQDLYAQYHKLSANTTGRKTAPPGRLPSSAKFFNRTIDLISPSTTPTSSHFPR